MALLLLASPDVDSACQGFCSITRKPAKMTIPCSHPNNCILCWDIKCKNSYTMFLQSLKGHDLSVAAMALLTRFDRKQDC